MVKQEKQIVNNQHVSKCFKKLFFTKYIMSKILQNCKGNSLHLYKNVTKLYHSTFKRIITFDTFNQRNEVHFNFLFAPSVAELYCAQSCQTGGDRFKPRTFLSIQPFGVFLCFLRNPRKYKLGSLRKTPTEGTLPMGPGHTSRELTLALKPTNQPKIVKKY